jgi:hypothetical protein
VKLTPSESKLVELLERAGGVYVTSWDAPATPEVHRLLRKIQRKGVVTIEPLDGGERITLTGAHNG